MQTGKENHWSKKKEAVHSAKPIRFLIFLLRIFPKTFVNCLVFPVGFFYFIFSERARIESARYQNQFIEFTRKKYFSKPKILVHIISFCLCVLEKIEGWSKKLSLKNVRLEGDCVSSLKKNLEKGRGALFIGSHLGNIEMLRSLASFGETGVSKKLPLAVIMETKTSPQFAKTLSSIDKNVTLHVVDAGSIGIETIIFLQSIIEAGGIVSIAGDRTSAHSSNRNLLYDFLGKKAAFPYGTFLLAQLLRTDVYFFFALRKKNATIFSDYTMYIHKSEINFANVSAGEKKTAIKKCSREFVSLLEHYCTRYPLQWYNFFDFWNCENCENGEKDE